MVDEHFNPLGTYEFRDELIWEIELLLAPMREAGAIQRLDLQIMTTPQLEAHFELVSAAFYFWLVTRAKQSKLEQDIIWTSTWQPESYLSPFSSDDIADRAG